MRVEFWLRIPGQHIHHSTWEMDAVPREGESVEVAKDDVRTVHSITWHLPGVFGHPKSGGVTVLLS